MVRFAIFLMVCSLSAIAGAQVGSPSHSGEIYALASGASDGTDTTNSFAGFQAGGAWRPFPRISLVADCSRFFATNLNANFTSFMAGPRFQGADHEGLSGFVELLLGAEHVNIGQQPASWNRVYAAGAGVDVRLVGPIVWRAFEIDAILIDKRGPGIPRIKYSSGLVVRLGHSAR